MGVDLILATTDLPEGRAVRCRELLRSALALTDNLLGQAKLSAAVLLGRKGGSQTAKRGSDYFRQLAAKRRTRSGGRAILGGKTRGTGSGQKADFNPFPDARLRGVECKA